MAIVYKNGKATVQGTDVLASHIYAEFVGGVDVEAINDKWPQLTKAEIIEAIESEAPQITRDNSRTVIINRKFKT